MTLKDSVSHPQISRFFSKGQQKCTLRTQNLHCKNIIAIFNHFFFFFPLNVNSKWQKHFPMIFHKVLQKLKDNTFSVFRNTIEKGVVSILFLTYCFWSILLPDYIFNKILTIPQKTVYQRIEFTLPTFIHTSWCFISTRELKPPLDLGKNQKTCINSLLLSSQYKFHEYYILNYTCRCKGL